MKTSLFLFAIALLSAGNNINSKAPSNYKLIDSELEVTCLYPSDTFYLESFPLYDMDGNLYIVRQAYTTKPTKEDTLEFLKYSRIQTDKMYDSVQRIKQKRNINKPVKKQIQGKKGKA